MGKSSIHGIYFKESGFGLVSIKKEGKELFEAPVRMNFWRALTDNDFGAWHNGIPKDKEYFNWRDVANTYKLISVTQKKTIDKSIEISYAMIIQH